MSEVAVDLTGRWQGIYNYPYLAEPNEFVATLIDRDGDLSGETEEIGTLPESGREAFPALIEGRRDGSSVAFRKFYDDLRIAADVVHYNGQVDPDGSEIAGNWHIEGDWGGTFIMIRPPAASVSVKAEVAEPVR